MKVMLKISVLLNMLFLAVLVFVLTDRRKPETALEPVAHVTEPSMQTEAVPVPAAASSVPTESKPFQWGQLDSGNDYRLFIANLRAVGCPENTVEDIVRGNVGRAFAWKRAQLGIDGSAGGEWSRDSEMRLVGSLLGRVPMIASAASPGGANGQTTEGDVADNTSPGQPGDSSGAAGPDGQAGNYPLFLQNVNWGALGFGADEQAAIAQARQQFLSEINGPGQNASDPSQPNSSPSAANPDDPGFMPLWQKALQDANDSLQASLGNQDFMNYELQEYYSWFKPQVVANVGGGNLNVNPRAFTPQ